MPSVSDDAPRPPASRWSDVDRPLPIYSPDIPFTWCHIIAEWADNFITNQLISFDELKKHFRPVPYQTGDLR